MEPTDIYDDLHIKKLDRVTIKQNVFVLMEGPNNSTDYTIIPLTAELTFLIGFKQGVGSKLGPMPDLAFKLERTSIKMKDCEYVANPFIKSRVDKEDDDEDFEEDDEESTGDKD